MNIRKEGIIGKWKSVYGKKKQPPETETRTGGNNLLNWQGVLMLYLLELNLTRQ